MLQIVVGALIGGLSGVALVAVAAKVRKRPITRGALVGAFVGGALSGALGASTFGLSMVGGSTTRAVVYLTAENAAQGAASQLAANAVDRKPLLEGVATTAAIGGATGPIGFLAGKGIVGKLVPDRAKTALVGGARKVPGPVGTILENRLLRLGVAVPDAGLPFPPQLAGAIAPPPGPPVSGLAGSLGGR